jgi:hypothetical protein
MHNHHGRFDYFKRYAVYSELYINQSNDLEVKTHTAVFHIQMRMARWTLYWMIL